MADKEIEINREQKSIKPQSNINATVTIKYTGRFDGVQVNAYITGTNEQVHFVNVDGKMVSLFGRLFVERNEFGEKNSFNFTAKVEGINLQKHTTIRFRAAIIQEHKEIASDVIAVPLI
ncbi:MAG: hypothetical protein ACE5J2_02570 [Nitrososphaerales archaeon]